MSPNSSEKRKLRFGRSILVGIIVGLILLLVSSAILFHERVANPFSFIQDAWICTRCGLQTRTTTYWVFQSRGIKSGILFKPMLPEAEGGCSHDPEQIGTRFGTLEVNPWNRAYSVNGFPDGDSFYHHPTLVEALGRIANTNRFRSELLIKDVYRLRTKHVDLSKVLPSLQTRNVESLIAELKGTEFNEVLMSN